MTWFLCPFRLEFFVEGTAQNSVRLYDQGQKLNADIVLEICATSLLETVRKCIVINADPSIFVLVNMPSISVPNSDCTAQKLMLYETTIPYSIDRQLTSISPRFACHFNGFDMCAQIL